MQAIVFVSAFALLGLLTIAQGKFDETFFPNSHSDFISSILPSTKVN